MTKKITNLMLNGENYEIREYQDSGWQPGANTVAYYAFDNDLNDGSGNQHTLTASGNNYSFTTGIKNECVNKASESYCFMANQLDGSIFSGNFTLLFFINFSSVSSVTRIMGEVSNYTNIQYESGQGGLQWYNNGESGRTKWSWTPSADTWYHIAITGDGNSYTAYLDGNTMTKVNQGTYSNSNGMFVLGTNSSTDNMQGFNGKFDEVIIENRVWSQAEIQNYLSNFTY